MLSDFTGKHLTRKGREDICLSLGFIEYMEVDISVQCGG